jgi:hypothetical protein
VHYAYGNIHSRQKNWISAKRDYETCLKIILASTPIHPLVAATYFSIGCMEFYIGNIDNAKFDSQLTTVTVLTVYRYNLAKALTIAELRSPNRDDGPIARIVFRQAKVLESDTLGRFADEAARLRNRAFLAQQKLVALGEGGEIPASENQMPDRDPEEENYNALVPLFYR